MHGSVTVDRKPIVFASLGTHIGSTIVEGQSTLESKVMCVGAARANFIVGNYFQDGEASHEVLDQGLGEGKAVEVLHAVELLDDL